MVLRLKLRMGGGPAQWVRNANTEEHAFNTANGHRLVLSHDENVAYENSNWAVQQFGPGSAGAGGSASAAGGAGAAGGSGQPSQQQPSQQQPSPPQQQPVMQEPGVAAQQEPGVAAQEPGVAGGSGARRRASPALKAPRPSPLAPAAGGPSAADTESEHWSADRSDDDADEYCVICHTGPLTHIFAPCGHQCVCEQCAATLCAEANASTRSNTQRNLKCPYCNGRAVMVIRVIKRGV